MIVVALVGCGKDSRPAENADKHFGNKKEGGANSSSKETKKGAANAKPEPTSKEGPEYLNRLPEAGAWVLHKWKVYGADKNEKGEAEEVKFTGSIKVSSLESEIIKGKRCRGVEMELKVEKMELPKGQKFAEPEDLKKLSELELILNFWFDENGLKMGEDPFKNLVSASILANGQVLDFPNVLTEALGASETKDKAKRLEIKEIETKLGKMKCSGDVRKLIIGLGNGMPMTLEVRRHESVPFGMVSTLATVKGGKDGEIMTVSFDVQEVGKGAVSKLPKSE
jgi:hypothetical protein